MTLAKQIIAHKKDGILSTKQIAAIVGCRASYVRAAWLRHTHPEKYRFREYALAYYSANREHLLEYQRAYYAAKKQKNHTAPAQVAS